jgi:hypothetical protein
MQSVLLFTFLPFALRETFVHNPATHFFSLRISSSNNTKAVKLCLVDAVGRVVEVKRGVAANSTVAVGYSYRRGVYYAEAMQEGKRVTIKLVKQSP